MSHPARVPATPGWPALPAGWCGRNARTAWPTPDRCLSAQAPSSLQDSPLTTLLYRRRLPDTPRRIANCKLQIANLQFSAALPVEQRPHVLQDLVGADVAVALLGDQTI